MKVKNILKKSASLLMSFMFLLMTNVFVAKAAAEQTFNGVKVTVTPDEESYTVGGEATKVTVTFKNENPYAIKVKAKEAEVLTSQYFAVDDSSIIPQELELKAGEPKSYEVPMSYTFKSFKTLDFYNIKTKTHEQINVGVVGSYVSIPKGSEFIADCHDISEEEYHNIIGNLDPSKHGNEVERAALFDLSIKNSAGITKQLGGYVKVYLQVPNGWDANELQSIFITPQDDEQFIEKLETIDGIQYVTFITNHFSPYALVDPKKPASEPVKAGDETVKLILPLVISAVLFLVLCLVMGKKRRSAALAIVLCTGLSVSAVLASASTLDKLSDYLQLNLSFSDYVKRESADSSDVAPVDVDTSINTRFSVTYDAPTLGEEIYDYDYNDAYEYDYYGGPFRILLEGGPEGWVGKLKVLAKDGTLTTTHNVDFAALKTNDNGDHIFYFDPIKGEGNGDEIEIGGRIVLEDLHGNLCDAVEITDKNTDDVPGQTP